MICLKDGSITVSSKQLILGSGSPRRRELLAVLGLHPADVRAPDVDETPRKGELPRSYCNRITASKAEALPAAADEVILCADTTVALGRRIMGKPADRDEARAFLQKLSGRRHKVITAVAVKTTERIWQKDVVSTVQMKRLSPQELEGYLATEDWQGKARAYTWQDAIAFAEEILDLCNLKYSVKRSNFAPWHPGRCAELIVNGKAVAHAGEVHPRILAKYGLPERSAAFAVGLSALPDSDLVKPTWVGTMPAAVQDVALIIDKSVSAQDVEAALRAGAGELLESISLFDRYDKLGDGKISLAFTLTFRAEDRTLTGAEVSEMRNAAVLSAEKATGAVLRTG